MPIYAKKINPAQRRALQQYEDISGFEPMGQADLDAGEITFSELWSKNIGWLEDMIADVITINLKGTGI